MNLKQIAAKKLIETELVPELKTEWEKFYHNATIEFPDIDDDKEWEWFWDCLGDHSSMRRRETQAYIKEQWDRDITLYQCGRSGATVYPDGFSSTDDRGFSRTLDIDALINFDDLESYEENYPDDDPETAGLNTRTNRTKMLRLLTVKRRLSL